MTALELIYAHVELTNAFDLALHRKDYIDKNQVKRINVKMVVNNRTMMMCINEAIQDALRFAFVERRKMDLESGVAEFDVVGPIMMKFKNRTATCNAFVLPGNEQPVLGAIALGEMDVIIDPEKQKLIVNPEHPDGAVLRI